MRIAASILVILAAGAASAQGRVDPRDLSGVWTNSTLTPLERPVRYGERRALTAEEARAAEAANDALLAERSAPTPAEATVEDAFCDAINCGYNQFWVDPGDRVMRVGGEPRTSLITFPATGRAPPRIGQAAQPQARRGPDNEAPPAEGPPPRRQQFADRSGGFPGQNDNPETRSQTERCLTFGNSAGPVMLPTLYNNTYRFVLTETHLAIWVEMIHDVRIVRIGGRHRKDGVRPWYGDSIGRWEGNTLVAETVNFHPAQSFRGASANLKVTERFTRVAPDRLLYQFKVEDPSVWSEPWGGEYEFGPAPGIFEYACHEGNYGLENILAGARHEEAEAATAAAR